MPVELARYIVDSKSFFHHIPRCGGTWIENALLASDLETVPWFKEMKLRIPRKHALMGHFVRSELAKIDYIFSFVRHPTTYYETTWRYLMSTSPKQRRLMLERWDWHPKRPCCASFSRNFNRWARNMMRDQGNWVTRLYESYLGPPGGEIVNFIGRRENLLNDFCVLLCELGHDETVRKHRKDFATLGRINARRKVTLEWQPEVLELVQHEERLAIDRFYHGMTYPAFKEFNEKSTCPPAFSRRF